MLFTFINKKRVSPLFTEKKNQTLIQLVFKYDLRPINCGLMDNLLDKLELMVLREESDMEVSFTLVFS